MINKKFNEISREVEEWNNLKAKIKEQVNIVNENNFEENHLIFRMLGIDKKKYKKKFVKVIGSFEEVIFAETFNAMCEYFECTLRRNYVFIEDISMFQNLFGIIEDRIKSNEEYIKEIHKSIKKIKDSIVNCKDYDKQQNLKYNLWGEEDSIKEYNKNINILKSLHRQLKFDIKKTETKRGSKKQRKK